MTTSKFMFGGFTPFPVRVPPGLVIFTYGGGVNTIANLALARRIGVVPHAIVMSNPGSERKATLRYLGLVVRPWCKAVGFPSPVVISRKSEARRRPRVEHFETLKEECDRIKSLPSIAYGMKRCSLKFKRDPQLWWTERQPWAQAEWAAGRRIIKAIGYDADENHRIRLGFDDPDEHAKYAPWYALHEAGIDRDGCVDLIRADVDIVRIAEAAGVDPVPPTSACTFCAANTAADWEWLRAEEPRAFSEAVQMSRAAYPSLTNPDDVGLMRCNPSGKRQLHVWADGGYGSCGGTWSRDAMPCECAL